MVMQSEEQVAMVVAELEPDSAMTLRAAFGEMFDQAEKWAAGAHQIVVTSEDQKREMRLARETRLALREIRVKAEHARKRLKEDSTRRGKAIDGMANVLKALIEPLEAHLLEQETFAERAEAKRRDDLRDARAETLRALGADPSIYANLGATSEETWALTLASAQEAHEGRLEAARQAEAVRVEAERIAAERREQERQAAVRAEAERAERERLQAEENARLHAEMKERERLAAIERERLEAERVAERAKAKAETEAREAELEAERKKASEAAAALEAERTAAARAKADAEAAACAAEARAERLKRQADEAEAAKVAAVARERERAAAAPDREKFAAFAAALRALPLPAVSSERGRAASDALVKRTTTLATWIDTVVEKL